MIPSLKEPWCFGLSAALAASFNKAIQPATDSGGWSQTLYAIMKSYRIYEIVNICVLLIFILISAIALFKIVAMSWPFKILSVLILFFFWGTIVERLVSKYTNQFVSKFINGKSCK